MNQDKQQEIRDSISEMNGTILAEELEANGNYRFDFTAPNPKGGEIRVAVWLMADGTCKRHVY